jgi:hypothetical protein
LNNGNGDCSEETEANLLGDGSTQISLRRRQLKEDMGQLNQEIELTHRATNEKMPVRDGDIAQIVDGRLLN